MNRFLQVEQILDEAVGGPGTPVAGPHRTFWRTQTRDQFVAWSGWAAPSVSPAARPWR